MRAVGMCARESLSAIPACIGTRMQRDFKDEA